MSESESTHEKKSEAGRKGGEARAEEMRGGSRETGRSSGGEGGMSREEAGRKGGEAVSQDREHMAEIGRKGGEAVSEDREHMAEIGKKGGEARGGQREESENR